MTLVFECETELGTCDADRLDDPIGNGQWLAFASTTAMTAARDLLRVEQRCYLRSADRPDEVRAQSWVQPEMTLEPMPDSKHDVNRMMNDLHARFVNQARRSFVDQSVLSVSIQANP